jgi:hypothetical protein
MTTAFGLLIALILGMATATLAQTPEASVKWHALRPEDAEGRAWNDTKEPFDRLPARAEGMVPQAVYNLSHHAAGLAYRFRTNAATVHIRWSVRSENLAMPHMPATGVSGVDLYTRAPGGVWRHHKCVLPARATDNMLTAEAQRSGDGSAEYLLYLPLYNGVTKIEAGVSPDAEFSLIREYPEERRRGIVFYGTSITQGGCASRPGLAFTAIVGRNLNTPVVNLGFSGNGKMEVALADLMAELDPALYVLDCLRNMSVAQVRERVEPFLRRLRKARPNTPIVLLEDAFLTNPERTPRGEIVREIVERLTKEGVPNLHYVPMRYALGTDGEGTVDGVHPNDLGMMRMAETLTPHLRRIGNWQDR